YGHVVILIALIGKERLLIMRIGHLAESILMRATNAYVVVLCMKYGLVAVAMPFTFGLIGKKSKATI
ncbi:MAG TPA: hypothetical protein PK212_06840, partial [Agitococcus sp.]|nr:hypothetical protein [Agitococcus sp.]